MGCKLTFVVACHHNPSNKVKQNNLSQYHIDSQFHGGDLDDFKSRLPVGTKVEYAPVQQGAALFHHQDVWHGSDVNKSTNAHRRALVAHYIRGDVTFRSGDEGKLRIVTRIVARLSN